MEHFSKEMSTCNNIYMTMKKNKLRFIFFLSGLLTIIIMVGCLSACDKPPERTWFNVEYFAAEGGEINGITEQIIDKGTDSETVTAVPDEGYHFTSWSDGVETAERKELNVQNDISVTASFEKFTYSVIYSSGPNGRISGKTEQVVKHNEKSEAVEALPDTGYMFIEWSDGVTTATRQDTVTADLSVTASFDIAVRTYAYDYNYATGNNAEESITLKADILDTASFIVPEKEYAIFGGWYLDSSRTIQVSDENGNLVIGTEIFDNSSNKLFAKWTATENITYKILLVFADEIKGSFETMDGTYVDVDYKLSPLERQVCEQIPIQLSKLLNEWFYGYINFEVDAYFTTQPIGIECFSPSRGSDTINYYLYAYNIPEVMDKLPDYRSVVTAFSMNDYDQILRSYTGIGADKFASIHLESVFLSAKINDIPYETFLDPNSIDYHSLWIGVLDTFVHELTHTIELVIGVDYFDYHTALDNGNPWDTLNETKLYLLNQYYYEGEKVGIPIDFWKGNIQVRAIYCTYEGDDPSVFAGRVDGDTMVTKFTMFGSDMEPVTATPNPGYRFVKWSDGVTTPTRQDKNVTSFVYIKAIFEKIE